MIAAVETWTVVAGTSAALLTLGLAWAWRRRGRADRRLVEDARDPYRRWIQGVFLLVTGDCDYGHLSGGEARRILAHWWDVYGPLEHHRLLQHLADAGGHDNAWDLIRFILVARLGAAAGLIDQGVSWAEILPVARRLQAAYPSWRAMAQSYVQARRQWKQLPLDGSADDQSMNQILDNLARLDSTRWTELDFHAELVLDEPVPEPHG